MGYVELMVTFGEDTATRKVKVRFLVIDCPSLYNCILGRPTLAELTVVPSTVHPKMKFYTNRARVATIQGDLAAIRRCFNAVAKGQSTIDTEAQPAKKAVTVRPEPQQSEPQPIRVEVQRAPPKVDSISLDTRFDQDEPSNEE